MAVLESSDKDRSQNDNRRRSLEASVQLLSGSLNCTDGGVKWRTYVVLVESVCERPSAYSGAGGEQRVNFGGCESIHVPLICDQLARCIYSLRPNGHQLPIQLFHTSDR